MCPDKWLRVPINFSMQHSCFIQFLWPSNKHSVIVRFFINKFLRTLLALTNCLRCLKAFQSRIVNLDLFQNILLYLRSVDCWPNDLWVINWIRCWLIDSRLRISLGLICHSNGLYVELLLILLLLKYIFHMWYLRLFILIVRVWACAAMMTNDKLVAPSVYFCDHLILLRCLGCLMASTTAYGACWLVCLLVIVRVARLLVGRRGHLQDI